MPRDLPGFYYDKGKGKYFRIESGRTAPSDADWNSDNVKKRKFEQDERNRKAELTKKPANSVVRNVALQVPIHGELLRQEVGMLRKRDAGALSAWIYCENLAVAGSVEVPNRLGYNSAGVMNPFCISSCDQSLMPHKAALHWVGSGRVPTPVSRVFFDVPKPGAPWIVDGSTAETHPQIVIPLVSEMKYHAPTDSLIVVGHGGLNPYHEISTIPVYRTPTGSLAEVPTLRMSKDQMPMWGNSLFHCTPAPAHASYLCTVGTSKGVLVVDEQYRWEVITAHKRHKNKAAFADIFVADPSPDNSRVMYAAGRPGYCWTVDTRVSNSDFTAFNHGITINHVRSINPHQVLVAGLNNKMAIYDLRWLGPRPEKRALPYTHFPEYRNLDLLDLGFDVDLDSGVVATAHNDGGVGIHSLRSGNHVGSVEREDPHIPVRCLQFHALPGEHCADLYIGATKNSITRCSRRTQPDEAPGSSESGENDESDVGDDDGQGAHSFTMAHRPAHAPVRWRGFSQPDGGWVESRFSSI